MLRHGALHQGNRRARISYIRATYRRLGKSVLDDGLDPLSMLAGAEDVGGTDLSAENAAGDSGEKKLGFSEEDVAKELGARPRAAAPKEKVPTSAARGVKAGRQAAGARGLAYSQERGDSLVAAPGFAAGTTSLTPSKDESRSGSVDYDDKEEKVQAVAEAQEVIGGREKEESDDPVSMLEEVTMRVEKWTTKC